MTQTTHTPGPWTIHRLTNGWPRILSAQHDVCDMMLNGNGLPHVEANARLIAAAPCLLEAADALIDLIESLQGESSVIDEDLMQGEPLRMLRDAIATATPDD